jgi:predicted HD phosphohydrolase
MYIKSKNSIFSKVFWITLFIKQNKYHNHGVFVHTLKVCFCAIKAKQYHLIVSSLLHDIGKPVMAYQDDEDILVDEYSFTHHEQKSYQMIKYIPFLSQTTRNIIRYHNVVRMCGNGDEEYIKLMATFDTHLQNELKLFAKFDVCGK